MKKNTYFLLLPFLLLTVISACKKDDELGSMEFKFTGLKDTVIYQGTSLSRLVSVYYLGGEREAVNISASGLPNGTTISFSNTSLEDGQSATSTLTSTATADTGVYVISVTGTTEKGTSITRTFQLHVMRKANTAPRINLSGSPNLILSLNSNYNEPGFAAGDDEDGSLTSQVIVSGSVNKDSVGLYTLSYVVTDSEGAKDSVVRIVNVKNDLSYLSGQFTVTTTNLANSSTRNWITTLSASVNTNNQVKVFKISDCFLADPVFTYNPTKDSIFLPAQTFSCQTALGTFPHTFEGKGVIQNGTVKRVKLDYTDIYNDPNLGTPVTLQLRDLYELN
ncbi:MAG: DUF5011 domain-containing protein [Bacteroidia bacterium]|nr:DUF5011 domain-containing protein [Bacteroidia bacterium]